MRTNGKIAVTCLLTLGSAFTAKVQAADPPESSSVLPTSDKAEQSSTEDTPATGQPNAKPETAGEVSREYSAFRQNSLKGSTGLLHIVSADSGAPGTFRVSFLSGYYSGSGFLCPSVAACGGQPAGVTATRDSVSRIGADFALSATLLPYLEGAIGTHSHAVSDNFGTPRLLQVLGDTYLGLKAFTPRKADKIFSFGGLSELRLLSGAGSIGVNSANLGFGALGTLDLTNRTDPKQRIPLRFHTNFGYLFDNSSTLATNTEIAHQHHITRIERFDHNINRVDSLFIGLGGEIMTAIFQPFAEWTIDAPSNRQGYRCQTRNLAAGDKCLVRASGITSTPSRLTLGTRLTPPFRGLSALLAFDIGTSATSTFVDERAPEIPWNFYFGVGYAIDTVIAPGQKPQPQAPQIVQLAPPPEHHIIGTVVDTETSQPIAKALLQFEGKDITGLVSRADGSFDSGNIPPGDYRFTVAAEGYKDGTCSGSVTAEPSADKTSSQAPQSENTTIKCSLKSAPSLGVINGTLTDADTNTPIAQALIRVRDERDRVVELQSNSSGTFRVENVPTGEVHVAISADGYLPSVAGMEVKKKVEQHTSLVLHKLPKKPNVTVTPKEIKLGTQVHFAPSSAEIAPESQILIQEIAAVIQLHPELKGVEIQAYTDDAGTEKYSQRLSEERAGAVRAALIALGVDSARLTATGFGSEKPTVPNTSEANRAKNRRIQLMILKRE